MFVRDDPLPVNVSEADGQTKIQFDPFPTRLDACAPHEGGGERHVGPDGDMHFSDVERHRSHDHEKNTSHARR